MVHEVNPVQRPTGVQRSGKAPPPRSEVRFEKLLSELTREMEALKPGTSEIRKPEDLEAALTEAGRKYKSCEKLKQNLIEAYRATVNRMET